MLRHVPLATILLALACSERTVDADDGTGAGDGSSGAVGDSAGVSGGVDATSAGSSCEWPTVPLDFDVEAPAQCSELLSVGEATEVTLRIRNDTDAIVWLTAPIDCSDIYVAVEDSLEQRYAGEHCANRCESALVGECGCLADCPLPDTIALQPGGTFTADWPGWVLEAGEHVASAECASADCAGPCKLATVAAAGPMRVIFATAGTLECGDDCACTPNADGWCIAPGLALDRDTVTRQEFVVEWPPPCPELEFSLAAG